MLFHMTIAHKAQDCPGRRPTDPPALVAPSDTREALGHELGVKLHFVLWGAACMLWAQPDHLAFAVLEADDVESAMQYVAALVPSDWTWSVLPVWNLPSQLRLIRQVRMASPSQFGDGLTTAERVAKGPNNKAEAPSRRHMDARPSEPPRPEESPHGDAAEQPAKPPTSTVAPEIEAPGTITRLLGELDAIADEPRDGGASPRAETPAGTEQIPPPSTQIIERHPRESQSVIHARLVASAGPTKGKTFRVGPDGATIGRLPEHRVYIPDERLSREHARIEFHDDRYWLRDLGSLNGTALNGTLVPDEQALQNGDTIELGSSKLVVTVESARPA